MSKLGGVDVAAGDDADEFAGRRGGGEGAGDGAGAGAFGDDVVVFREDAHGGRDGIEIRDETTIDQSACAFEHLREDGAGANAVDPGRLIVDYSWRTSR